MSTAVCPACGETAGLDEAFCESCGAALGAPGGGIPGAPDRPAPCSRCGAAVGEDGYCSACGWLQERPGDHVEVDLGALAAVSDRGLRHHRNEDATAVVIAGRQAAAVVCDGVSSSANPDRASAAASEAAIAVLAAAIRTGEPAPSALARAVESARHAAEGVEATETTGAPAPPSTTLVAAIAAPGTVTVANIGDSRAYWFGAHRAELLTTDDSWAEAAIAAGVQPSDAYASRQAHMITRWLGSDSDHDAPTVTTFRVDAPGTVVLCSDGLWNYYRSPDALAALVGTAGDETPLALGRRLVAAALAAGGHDNVSVVIIPTGPDGVAAADPPATRPVPSRPDATRSDTKE